MTIKSFAPGEYLCREGDLSDCAYLIQSGTVSILKTNTDGEDVFLTQLGGEEYIGEMGLIENRPRSASAKAITEVTAQRLFKREFLSHISNDETAAFKLLYRLSERLHLLSEEYVSSASQSSSSNLADNPLIEASTEIDNTLPSLRLEPDSKELEDQLREPITISQFPFFIGRELSDNEKTPLLTVHLKIRDAKPFRMSRVHLVVQKLQDDQFLVRDLDSALGTIVDGKAIGREFSEDAFRIPKEGASITLGGVSSPYNFRVTPI